MVKNVENRCFWEFDENILTCCWSFKLKKKQSQEVAKISATVRWFVSDSPIFWTKKKQEQKFWKIGKVFFATAKINHSLNKKVNRNYHSQDEKENWNFRPLPQDASLKKSGFSEGEEKKRLKFTSSHSTIVERSSISYCFTVESGLIGFVYRLRAHWNLG